jgi:hypothetical protein
VTDGVAVRGQRRRGGVDLLDPPEPQLAALVLDVVLEQLDDPPLDPERVALRGDALAVQGAEHPVGVRLEHRHRAVRAVRHRALEVAGLRLERATVHERLEHPPPAVVEREREDPAAPQLRVRHADLPSRARLRHRRADRHDGVVAEVPHRGGHLLDRAGLEERRGQADRRLRRADLLDRAQVHVAPARDDPAVAHLSRPATCASARRPRSAWRRRW